jgi:hypothetical protein
VVAAGDAAMPGDVASLRDELRTARAELHGLREAMSRRAVIEQAKGVFMERYRVDDDGAFARLVALSQSTNVKLVQIATDVVARSGAPGSEGGGSGWIDRALDAFGEPALVLSPVPTERGSVADFQVDHANRTALGWVGRPREFVVRASTSTLFPGPNGTLLVNVCRRALATGTMVAMPWPLEASTEGSARTWGPEPSTQRAARLHAARIGTVVLATWQIATA